MPDFLRRFGQRHTDGETPEYYFSNVRSGLIVGLLSIGTLFGALAGAPIADWIGRKRSIIFWCAIFSVGIIVQLSATDKWYQIMLGRLIAGLGVGALSLLVPMYQAETAPRHIRGALISTYQLMITFGIFLAAVFNFAAEKHQTNNAASWQITLGLSFVFPAILAGGILFFSETPRFLFRHGKEEQAKQTMCKVYGVGEDHYGIHMELEEIRMKLAEETNQGTAIQEWFRMWKAPKMAYRLAIGMGLQMFQQLTGSANYFFYYGTVVFRGTGINNSFVTQMILNGINFGVTFYGLYIVEHYGIYFFVIEGQGRTLEEIDTMYLLGVKPWESSKWVAPDLDELDPKTRRVLAETNPEIMAAALRDNNGMDRSEKVEKEETEA
ncbi:hexose transporter hxt5 [Paraconiothyrium brasiliense]|uniref:Hexose transporter hxt5 n=1 Tax=Paraconiothyrium brasiliense TaxID=300254 RepID=A0ABR3R388_9PLEO